MFIQMIYLDLADISMFYCDYNITMNIWYIHIGIFLNSTLGVQGEPDIALGIGAGIRSLAT